MSNQPVLRVCLGPGCLAQGADKVVAALKKACKAKGQEIQIEPMMKETGCHGFCKVGSLSLTISPGGSFLHQGKTG